MKTKRLIWTGLAMSLVLFFSAQGFAQVESVQNRIPQQVIINGQRVNGAYVMAAGGGLQSFTCPNPQSYGTPDGASQGWACFDQATSVWLLPALPPSPPVQQAPVVVQQQPPTVIYQQPPTVIYQQSVPATVIYTSPAPVIVRPAYRPAVVLGAAAIHATGRIVSAAIYGSHRYQPVYHVRTHNVRSVQVRDIRDVRDGRGGRRR